MNLLNCLQKSFPQISYNQEIFNYIEPIAIKLTGFPFSYIVDQVDSGSSMENIFSKAAKMFLI
jgi:hypothetical protein